MASEATAERSAWSRRVEKEFLRQGTEGPYRKPTQVGELNMLRRTEEFALRNSAKCIRNFGRSMAAGVQIPGGCRETAQATVYQKHRSMRTSDGKYMD